MRIFTNSVVAGTPRIYQTNKLATLIVMDALSNRSRLLFAPCLIDKSATTYGQIKKTPGIQIVFRAPEL